MARIIYPATALGWKKLIDAIDAKHVADGVNSILTQYLTENGVVMATLKTAAADAVTFDAAAGVAGRTSEKAFAEQKKLFKFVFPVLRSSYQALKGFYKNNINKIGDWGGQVTNGRRLDYPASFVERKTMWDLFFAKHSSFPPPTSPVQPFADENDINYADLNLKAGNALTQYNIGVTQAGEREEKIEARNDEIDTVEAGCRGIGGYLIKQLKNNPKRLGDYEFQVDHSDQGTTRRKGSLLPSEQKKHSGCFIGGFFINTGIENIDIYAGKTVSGAKVTVGAGDQWVILKGYSSMVIVNTSAISKGSFLVDKNK